MSNSALSPDRVRGIGPGLRKPRERSLHVTICGFQRLKCSSRAVAALPPNTNPWLLLPLHTPLADSRSLRPLDSIVVHQDSFKPDSSILIWQRGMETYSCIAYSGAHQVINRPDKVFSSRQVILENSFFAHFLPQDLGTWKTAGPHWSGIERVLYPTGFVIQHTPAIYIELPHSKGNHDDYLNLPASDNPKTGSSFYSSVMTGEWYDALHNDVAIQSRRTPFRCVMQHISLKTGQARQVQKIQNFIHRSLALTQHPKARTVGQVNPFGTPRPRAQIEQHMGPLLTLIHCKKRKKSLAHRLMKLLKLRIRTVFDLSCPRMHTSAMSGVLFSGARSALLIGSDLYIRDLGAGSDLPFSSPPTNSAMSDFGFSTDKTMIDHDQIWQYLAFTTPIHVQIHNSSFEQNLSNL
ncbi:uncharacterized protein BDR25DRAFT_394451 [Lindgomyces ingoldianus]|uniref:Uncharacterized protein n=1 Tax=Lindgomyces ingoldianus TaxID=673940 RepID=A0ACB6QPV7_9PLEO|nr:uncharacterized protein BDR25DRAFT_394451 [Lindgomyces ingoldianus]KAF2469014.1 hypothetical protein BDR25DRAFT_394451 [Lindgomyces ingoldianus]